MSRNDSCKGPSLLPRLAGLEGKRTENPAFHSPKKNKGFLFEKHRMIWVNATINSLTSSFLRRKKKVYIDEAFQPINTILLFTKKTSHRDPLLGVEMVWC